MQRQVALAVLLFGTLLAAVAPAGAQSPSADPTTPVVSLILPNYNSLAIGEVAGLEGGAFVARANDTSSGFYNPAGLVRAERSLLSGSAGVFQFGAVSTDAFNNQESSFQQIPAMFGFVLNDLGGRTNWAGGLSIARVNAWSQTTEAERVDVGASGTNRFRFSTDAAFDSWQASLALAYARPDGRAGFGGSIDAQYSSASRRQVIADQLTSAAGLAAVNFSSSGIGTTTHLRATVGAQFTVTPSVRAGVVLRTPGLRILRTGSASLESLSQAGRAARTVSFFAPDAETQLNLPLELRGGVAWSGRRVEFEFDLFGYTGSDPYDLFTSAALVTTVVDAGTGGVPVVTTQPYVSPVVHRRGVVNVAVGGHYNLSETGGWVLHGGYTTDRSPVADADTAFTKVNQQKVTVGLSGRTSFLLASVGFQYLRGKSDPLTVQPPGIAVAYGTRFTATTVGIVYSLSVLF